MEQFAMYERVMENFVVITDTIQLVLENSIQKSNRMRRLPQIEIGISGQNPQAYLAELREKGKILPGDWTIVGTPMLMNTFQVTQVIVVRYWGDSDVRDIVHDVFSLLFAIRRFRMAEVAVRLGLTLTFDADQPLPHVDYTNDFTPEKYAEVAGRSPRQIVDGADSIVDWASDFRKASEKGTLTAHKGLDSKENQESLRHELFEFVKAFSMFKGYEESFKVTNGYSVGDFVNACEALARLARPCFHPVYQNDKAELAKEVRRITKLSNAVVGRILLSLTWRNGANPLTSPILPVGSQRIFSMRGAMSGELSRLEAHFGGPQYSDQAGKHFEARCRDILASQHFKVYPDRLDVVGEYLPTELSVQLWNHIKTGTDIDVLAARGDFVLVLECKERNHASKKIVPLAHLLDKLREDLVYRTRWIQHESLEGLIGKEWATKLTGSGHDLWLVPLIVTNYPIDMESDAIPIITFQELGRLGKGLESVKIIEKTTESSVLELPGVTRGVLRATAFKLSV